MLRVGALAIAPVKGMRTVAAEALELAASGPVGDRGFHVREADGAIALTKRNPRLVQVVPRGTARELGSPSPTAAASRRRWCPAAVSTTFYDGRAVPGRVVEGPFGPALSHYLGRPLELVAHDDGVRGGDDHPVTLMSDGSLAAVSAALDGVVVDPRRFRMTIAVEGAQAWEEDGWAGGEVTVGSATLRVAVPTERCAVTTRDPDDGHGDLPVLRAPGAACAASATSPSACGATWRPRASCAWVTRWRPPSAGSAGRACCTGAAAGT